MKRPNEIMNGDIWIGIRMAAFPMIFQNLQVKKLHFCLLPGTKHSVGKIMIAIFSQTIA